MDQSVCVRACSRGESTAAVISHSAERASEPFIAHICPCYRRYDARYLLYLLLPGTVPMPSRRDPMSAAAEAISAIEGTCLGRSDHLGGVDVEGEALVCTVGRIHGHPNQVRSVLDTVQATSASNAIHTPMS